MEDVEKPRRRGAPITERNRIPVGIRMTPGLRDKLIARSGSNGRSITQEIELLLEQGLRDEDAFKGTVARMYGRQFAGVLLVLARAMHEAGRNSLASRESQRNPRAGVAEEVVAGWLHDPWAYDQAVRAANTVLETYRPEGKIVPPPPAPLPEWWGDDSKATYAEAQQNPGSSFAAGILATIIEKRNREAWLDEVRDLLADLADRDVRETQT